MNYKLWMLNVQYTLKLRRTQSTKKMPAARCQRLEARCQKPFHNSTFIIHNWIFHSRQICLLKKYGSASSPWRLAGLTMTARGAHEGCIRCREGGRSPLRKCQKLVARGQKPEASSCRRRRQGTELPCGYSASSSKGYLFRKFKVAVGYSINMLIPYWHFWYAR